MYLASCGSAPCDNFDASNAQWFKITEVGKRNDGWVQQDQCMQFFCSSFLLLKQTEPLQLMERPILSHFLPISLLVDTFFVTRSLPFIWLINLEVPSSTPLAPRSTSAAASPGPQAPTNSFDSLVPTATTTPESSSTPSTTLPMSSLVPPFPS